MGDSDMTTEWKHRIIVIIPANQQEVANSLAAQLTGNTADALTFGTPLSADGTEPSTHLACFTSATDALVYGDSKSGSEAAQVGLLGLAEIVPGLVWWRLDLDGILRDTNTDSTLNQSFTFQDALSKMNLQFIEMDF